MSSDLEFGRDLEYLRRIHPEIDPLLRELEDRGQQDEIPIVSREVGRFLSGMTSCMLASNILELGTAYGYSTLWMARAQPDAGRIQTIDPDRTRTEIARSFFERAGVADRIEIINQPALRVLPNLPPHLYDIVFIDALKEEYADYLALSAPLLKRSGLVIMDNMTWFHRLSQPPGPDDMESTKALRRAADALLHHPDLNATIIPLGDGIGIGAKIR